MGFKHHLPVERGQPPSRDWPGAGVQCYCDEERLDPEFCLKRTAESLVACGAATRDLPEKAMIANTWIHEMYGGFVQTLCYLIEATLVFWDSRAMPYG